MTLVARKNTFKRWNDTYDAGMVWDLRDEWKYFASSPLLRCWILGIRESLERISVKNVYFLFILRLGSPDGYKWTDSVPRAIALAKGGRNSHKRKTQHDILEKSPSTEPSFNENENESSNKGEPDEERKRKPSSSPPVAKRNKAEQIESLGRISMPSKTPEPPNDIHELSSAQTSEALETAVGV